MGILALIQGEKNKFKNNASKEEVNNARKGFVQEESSRKAKKKQES
jgi:hypothetical protein